MTTPANSATPSSIDPEAVPGQLTTQTLGAEDRDRVVPEVVSPVAAVQSSVASAAVVSPDVAVQPPAPVGTTAPAVVTAPVDTTAPTSKKPSKVSRDPWPDNLRMLAAIVICSFHFADQFRQPEDSFTLLWYLLWGARVPVFVLIAGYFSPSRYSRKMFVSLIRSVVGVFLIFTLFHALINVAFGKDFVFNIAEPYLGLWFLISLLVWRLTLPLIIKIPGYFVWALLAALAFGMCKDLISEWPITRTFSYLPMFVVGHWLRTRPDFRDLLSTVKYRIAAVLFIVASWVFFAFTYTDMIGPRWNMKWAYKGDLTEVSVVISQMSQRLGIICFGIVFAMCVIALIPRVKVPFLTVLGSGSFYVYLLHPLVLRVLNNLDFFDHVNTRSEKLIVFVGAAVLAVCLATPPVRKVFRPLVQPRYHVPFLSEPRPRKKQRTAGTLGVTSEPGATTEALASVELSSGPEVTSVK